MGAGETERLKQLLKRPENRTCADCDTKQPRWASFNLGCFICIRCSGIHRSIGVHVSKVRSVTLDDWQSAWVDNMERWGNKKVNQLYEAKLGTSRKPDGTASDRDLEYYIRQKYEHKTFMAKESARKSKTEKISSEEESEEESESSTDESDTSEDEEIQPPKANLSKPAAKVKETRSSRPKATRQDEVLTKFEKVAVSSSSEPFADFVQAPVAKPSSSHASKNNHPNYNDSSSHNSNDFGQFSDFFGAESKPAELASASNDKDFIMSLFQSSTSASQPAFAPGPIQSGLYMQAPSSLPYTTQGIPQAPYGQQMMQGMPAATPAYNPSGSMMSYATASMSANPVGNGQIPSGFGANPPEMMPSYPPQMINVAPMMGGRQQSSPSSMSYGQTPQQAPWPSQNPYQ